MSDDRCFITRIARLAGTGVLIAGLGAAALAQEPAPAEDAAEEPVPPASLSELAARADLVALVQVMDTDYEYAREFPVGGTAFLKVIIPYRTNRPLPDLVEVYEEGLHVNECYFPNPPVTEEGRRYLLFARDNPDVEGQYLPLEQGCSLTVLVAENNRYALRYPLEGLAVTDTLEDLARPMTFADAHAVLEYEELSVEERSTLLEQGLLEELEDRRYRLTHGVPIGEARAALGEENLTRDRSLLRPAPPPEATAPEDADGMP